VAILGILAGPSTGAGATLLILGSHDLGAVAASDLLLTATGALGPCLRRVGAERPRMVRARPVEPPVGPSRPYASGRGAAAAMQALGRLSAVRRRRLESTYFEGVTGSGRAHALPFHAHECQPAERA
jgi:hypothetical protein